MNNNENLDKVVYLRLDDIIPNRFQPREVFDETGLEELADSIKEHGVIQPIIVRRLGDKFELIAGERRSKASALAGLTTIPAIIRNMDDKESAKVSLLENLQRKNLSAIEEARTYKRILELDNMTQEDLAKTMGKSQPLVANKLRLLSLPEEVQDALIKNQISERHARSLLNVKDKETQLMFLDRIRNERLTVRELDVEIKKMKEGNESTNFAVSNNNIEEPSFNTFNEPTPVQDPIPFTNQFNNNYQGNFNNMGLNDYRSQVNSNMFNNIPNTPSYDFNNQFNNSFGNMPNLEESKPISTTESTNLGSNNFSSNDNLSTNSFMNNIYQEQKPENNLNTNQDMTNNYSSLGSMFDGGIENTQKEINTFEPENSDNKNIFISHIKENEMQKQGNQFLPNFLDTPIDNNGRPMEGGFSNNQNDFPSTNFMEPNINTNLNSSTDYSSFNQDTFNQNINQPTNAFGFESNGFTDMNMNTQANSFQTPTDFNSNSFNFNDNQGNLFNQPLNIVDVPNNNYNENNYNADLGEVPSESDFKIQQEEINQDLNLESKQIDSQDLKETFDNPFDDPYENILFAKPVPITPDETKEEINNENVELIGENKVSEIDNEVEVNQENNYEEPKQEESYQYISLEPERTIYDTRGAVLELKKTTDRIKQNNINMETEEIDFDDYYQIIIKIKKEQ